MCYYLGKTRQACEARERAIAEQEEQKQCEAQEQKKPDSDGYEPIGQAEKTAA
jgi:hypothetical protein